MLKLAGTERKLAGESMSIEIPELNLDALPEDVAEINATIDELEKREHPLVNLIGSLEHFDKVRAGLMALRAANISAILKLQRTEVPLEDDEIQYLFSYLRDWDQLLLVNFLTLCEDWLPKEYRDVLTNEAKIEMKWFKEWASAVSDRRIGRLPGLPWRSFMRKINSENFEFARKFIAMVAEPATPENVEKTRRLISEFVEAKKKVVCVFPKKWGVSH